MSEPLTRPDLAHRDESDLTAHSEIWIARVIRIQHRQFAFLLSRWRDEQIVVDLNLNRSEPRRDFAAQRLSINDVAAFYHHDFIFGNIRSSEQTASMDFALAHFRFRREIRKSHHERSDE